MAAIFVATAPFILAPAGSQPEFLSNVQPDRDATNGEFIIEFRATSSLADRAVEAGYLLVTTIAIRDRSGQLVADLRDSQTVEKLERAEASQGMVPLQPQTIEWLGAKAGVFLIQHTTVLTTADGGAVPVFGYTGAGNSYRLLIP
jgi:hypothetical protein